MNDLTRCARCLKMTDGVHTCTPTEQWRKLEQERDDLKAQWDYYQQFVKAHGATSITALVVQRDELLAALERIANPDEWDCQEIARAAIAIVKEQA